MLAELTWQHHPNLNETRNDEAMRRGLTSLCLILLVMAAAGGALGAGADARPTTLYVGAVGGQGLTSQLVVLLSATDSLDSFDITLSYDASLLSPERVDLAEHWTAATDTPPSSAPGELGIRASTQTECAAGSTCLLGTVTWKALGEGTSSVDAMKVILQHHGVALIDVDSVPGEVQVSATGSAPATNGTPSAAPAGTTDSVAGARSPGSSDRSIGLGLVLLLVGLIAVSGAAILAAVFVTALARRSWRWSSKPPGGSKPGSPSAPARADARATLAATHDLGPRIQEYLSQVEAFGMVAANSREDRFLTEVALSGPASQANSNGHNGTSNGENDQATPASEAEATK
jgi:hypothetical protein